MKKLYTSFFIFSLLLVSSGCTKQQEDAVVSVPPPKTVIIPPPTPTKPPLVPDQQASDSGSVESKDLWAASWSSMPSSPPSAQTGSIGSIEYFRYEDLIHGYSVDLPKVFEKARITSSASGAAMTFVIDMTDTNSSVELLTFVARPWENDDRDAKLVGSWARSTIIGTNDTYTLSYSIPTDINRPAISMYYSSIGNAYRVKLSGSWCTTHSMNPQCEYYDWASYLKNHIKFKK